MCNNKTVIHTNNFSLCLLILLLSGIFLNCQSIKKNRPVGFVEVKTNTLEQLPEVRKRGFNKKETYNAGEYIVKNIKYIEKLEQGRVDLSGKLKYTQRRLFTISDEKQLLIEAETLFVYSKEGFDNNLVEVGTYYGRTSQYSHPFTISLSADTNNKIFSGKSKRKNIVLDIEGTPYTQSSYLPKEEEIAFLIKKDDVLVGYVDLSRLLAPLLYIDNTVDTDTRVSILYTMIFAIQYQRYKGFLINTNLVRGE